MPFNPEVCEMLGYYVYRLIDPRNGETFYVGRGQNNRVFDHIRNAIRNHGDARCDRINRINEIRMAGLDVIHVIHRYGMTEDVARHVEAALIDAYPGLTNIQGGYGGRNYGPMHSNQIINLYAAEEAEIRHRAMLLILTARESSLYEATRYAWRVNLGRARQAEVILPVIDGIIRGAFVADKWLEFTPENFPGVCDEAIPGRYGFVGHEAEEDVKNYYIGRRIPDNFLAPGMANPVRYTYRG